jgi:hypothetical protein
MDVAHTRNTNYWFWYMVQSSITVTGPRTRDSRLAERLDAEYVTLHKIFLTSKFSYLLFSNPTHKTKTGTGNWLEITILTHLDQSNYLNAQHQVLALLCIWPVSANCAKLLAIRPFCCAELASFDFSLFNFNLQGDTLSTGGLVLSWFPYLSYQFW